MENINVEDLKQQSQLLKELTNSQINLLNINKINNKFIEIETKKSSLVNNKYTYHSQLGFIDENNNLQLVPHCQNIEPCFKSKINSKNNLQIQIQNDPLTLKVVKEQQEIIEEIKLEKYHDKLINNPIIGEQLVWNENGDKVIYIAQSLTKKVIQGYEGQQQNENDKDNLKQFLRNNEYEQDFGEKFKDIKQIQIFEFDLKTRKINLIPIPENIFPSQINYINDDQIVFAGVQIQKEFKYGIHLCINRECNIFLTEKLIRIPDFQNDKMDINEYCSLKKISDHYFSFYPVYNKNNNTIIYCGSDYKVAHLNYMSLNQINLSSFKIEKNIIPINENNLTKEEGFMGIIGYFADLQFQYLNDQNLLFTSLYGGNTAVFLLDIKTKKVQRLDQLWSQDCNSSISHIKMYNQDTQKVYLSYTSYKQPQQIVVLDVQDINNIIITLNDLLSSNNKIQQIVNQFQFSEKIFYHEQAEGFLYSIESVQENSNIIKDFEINKNIFTQEKRKLVVFLHGGPHGNAKVPFGIDRLLLLLQGYRILSVNFSGSAGYGQTFLESLLTKIGERDTNEILDIIQQIAAKNLIDLSQVTAYGNSYGGYLSAIMASRFSEYFKGTVIMNPVISMPFMVHMSDIPEWCIAEACGTELNWNLQAGQIKEMYNKSPFSESVKIPIMLMLGAKDQRVPHQAALTLRAQTLFNDKKVVTYMYQNADHSLCDCPQTEFDVSIKISLFIKSVLQNE